MSNMTYCPEVRHLEIEVALKKAPTVRLVPSCRSWRTRSVRLLTRAVQCCQRLAPNRDRQGSGRGLLQLGTRSEFETYPDWGPRVDTRRWTVLISMEGLRCVHAGEPLSNLGPQDFYFPTPVFPVDSAHRDCRSSFRRALDGRPQARINFYTCRPYGRPQTDPVGRLRLR
jgi:hypothetical protein